MFSALNARVLARLGAAAAGRPLAASVPVSRVALSLSRRTFLTTPSLSFAAAVRPPTGKAAAATKKPAPKRVTSTKKKDTTKKAAAPKKKVAAKKPAAKKAAPKKKAKKVVKKKAPKKKVAVPKAPPRVLKSQGPPSRGPTSFFLFARDFRKTQPHDASVTDIARAAGAAWRALSDSEKEAYLTRARAERALAKVHVDEYFANVDPDLLRRLNKQRAARKLPRIRSTIENTNKRPLSGFLRFSLERRIPGIPVVQQSKQRAQEWHALPEAEKAAYNKRFEVEMAEWKKAQPPKATV
ncbi:hypothetical protein DFH06DRAFT_1205355 [Mycena polygramma]|nr:hypothetical protein DFH06DRAFT_1205355 [Mycena polygramma]